MAIILSLIYVFLPPVITQVFYPGSVFITGAHTHLSELGIVSLMVYLIVKRKTADLRAAALLAAAFLLVFFADFIYTYKFNFALAIPLAVSRLSSLCYSGFMITLSVYLFSSFKKFLRDRISLGLFALIFAVFAYLNFEYVLSAIYSRNVGSSFSHYLSSALYFYYANTTVYAFFLTINISLLIPVLIRTRRMFETLFCSALLLVPIADFAIRFEEITRAKSSIPTPFGHGWEIGMASVFALLLYKRKLPEFTDDTVVSYFSIRVLLVASILVFSTLLVSALFPLKIAVVRDAFNLSNVLFVLYLVIFLSNLIAIRISSHVSSLGDYMETLLDAKRSGGELAAGGRLEVLEKTANIYEVDNILKKYNDLTDHANSLHELALRNSRLAAIGQTTRLVAHDVRKPFSLMKSVLSSFEELARRPAGLETARKDIRAALAHVETMIADMMDLSREARLQTNPESLSELVRDTVRMLELPPGTDIRFHYDFPERDLACVDGQRLKRAIANIAGNAIEAITAAGKKDRGNVYFRAEERDGWMELSIGNDGPSLPPEDLHRIFDSFFTRGKRDGTGLGLASARKIAELHGGSILAANRDGGGVEFLLRLPLSCPPPAGLAGASGSGLSETAPAAGAAPSAGRIILACDDDALARRCISISLESALKGTEAYVFPGAEELLCKFRELLASRRDAEYVVFTDQNMDGMSGLELVRALRAEKALCRIFMVSSEPASEFGEKALAAGADAYYEGPLDAELLARIGL